MTETETLTIPRKTWTVYRDEEPDLTFEGEVIAEATSHTQHNNLRWTELTLYRTTTNRYVVERIGRTRWEKETDSYEAFVTREETHSPSIHRRRSPARDEIKKFLGYGWLAKELYDAAEIEASDSV